MFFFFYSIGTRDNVTQFISNLTLTLSEEKSNSVKKSSPLAHFFPVIREKAAISLFR